MGIRGHGTGIHFGEGFTVFELLVTLSIAAILLSLAVPSLQHFTREQHLKAAIGNLHSDLLLARGEAIFRNAVVVACPGDDEEGCSGNNDWSAGWVVFPDANGDRQRQPGETLLRQGQVIEHLLITGSSGRSAIRFFPDGSAPASNGSIAFCGAAGPPRARKLVISNVGRIRRDMAPETDPGRCPGS